MDLMRILGAALGGWRTENRRMAVAAHNIANANTEGFAASRVDGRELPGGGVDGVVRPAGAPGQGVDLAEELIQARVAEHAARADLLLVKTADRLADTAAALLDKKA